MNYIRAPSVSQAVEGLKVMMACVDLLAKKEIRET